jgi:hypothetical protein
LCRRRRPTTENLGLEAFPERMLSGQRFELADDVGMAGKRKVGVDPSFEAREPDFLQAGDFRLGERLVEEVRERRPAPESQSEAQCVGRLSSPVPLEQTPPLFVEPLELVTVAFLRADAQQVARRFRADAILIPERLA